MPEEQPLQDDAVPATDITLECWRCGLEVADDAEKCPHCDARLSATASMSFKSTSGPAAPVESLNLLFCTYVVLLATGLIHAFVLGITVEDKEHLDRGTRKQVFTQILVVEGIDTIVALVAVIATWRHLPRTLPPRRARLTAWILAIPILAALLLLNFGYHELLRRVLHVPLISRELMEQFDLVALIAICVQPAIVEEAYCRLFALDSLQGALGSHAAVWISATMFGLMHVAVFPSIPYLILMGAFLAYMRLASGTLLLPILLHFVHNLVVLLIECR